MIAFSVVRAGNARDITSAHLKPVTRAKSPSRAMAQPKKMRRAPPGGRAGGRRGEEKTGDFFSCIWNKKDRRTRVGGCDGHPPAAPFCLTVSIFLSSLLV